MVSIKSYSEGNRSLTFSQIDGAVIEREKFNTSIDLACKASSPSFMPPCLKISLLNRKSNRMIFTAETKR